MKQLLFAFLLTLTVVRAFSQININGDIIGFWNFNADADEFFLGEINGTLNSCAPSSDRFDNKDKALSFDGKSSGVIFDKPLLPTDSSDWTLSVWFKCDYPESSTHEIIFSQYQFHGTVSENRFHIFAIENEFVVFYGGFGRLTLGDANTDWNNIQITVESNQLKAYLNGELKGEAELFGIQGMNSTVGYDNVQTERRFKGSIDDLRIYSKALTETELKYVQYGSESACEQTIIKKEIVHLSVYDTIYKTVVKEKEEVHRDTITDTVHVLVYDTIRETVYDTLFIKYPHGLASSETDYSEVSIFPNPASDVLNITYSPEMLNTGTLLKIVNMSGITVFSSEIKTDQEAIEINTIGGVGTYSILIYDINKTVLATKFIVVE